jgi:hypothetical protein
MLPADQDAWALFRVGGDFNGDGLQDVLVRRSPSQYDLYLNVCRAGRSGAGPALAFETPVEGTLTVRDLNGDGLADLVVQGLDDPRVVVFLSVPADRKGGHP